MILIPVVFIIDASNPHNIQLAIPKNNASEFLQWCHFSIEGEVGETFPFRLTNAGQSSYRIAYFAPNDDKRHLNQ